MNVTKWQRTIRSNISMFKCKRSIHRHSDTEYTATPQYPPILDLSYEKGKKRVRQAAHDEIANVKTVEEKQIKLNMPKYYGFKTLIFKEDHIPYNNLKLVQHCTRTHLIDREAELPKYYENIGVNSAAIGELKRELQEAILTEFKGYKNEHNLRRNESLTPTEMEDFIGSRVVRQLNGILTNKLCRFYNHLIDLQVDLDPRIETSWTVGGIDPPESVKSSRRGLEWMKHVENEPVDRNMTFVGSPYLTLRSKQPLPSLMSLEEASCDDLDVPQWKHDPRVVGIAAKPRRIVNIPGFWPGDEYRFGVLQYLKRGHLLNWQSNEKEVRNALIRQGILSSFAWSHAQANHLGFTTFNELTYPISTQTIITNGQLFSFYVYQLNTTLLHSENHRENARRNACWATCEMKLFDRIADGKMDGFNDQVLVNLVKFYANSPSERLGVDLTPFLGQGESVSADYKDDEKREWLEREYKFIASNRPRHLEMDEIYAWEKIYKIDNNTRPMDKRTRFFELRQHPTKRTLNDRKPKYVPKALRPHLPKYKGRDAKEFFP